MLISSQPHWEWFARALVFSVKPCPWVSLAVEPLLGVLFRFKMPPCLLRTQSSPRGPTGRVLKAGHTAPQDLCPWQVMQLGRKDQAGVGAALKLCRDHSLLWPLPGASCWGPFKNHCTQNPRCLSLILHSSPNRCNLPTGVIFFAISNTDTSHHGWDS